MQHARRRLCGAVRAAVAAITLCFAPLAGATQGFGLSQNELLSVSKTLRLSDYRLQVSQVEADPVVPGRHRFEIDLGEGPVELVLDPYSLRAPDFAVQVFGEAGRERLVAPPPLTTYRGVLASGSDATVVGSIVSGRLRATVYPNGGGDPVNIQPLEDALPGRGGDTYVVYRDSDVLEGHWTCGNDHTLNAEAGSDEGLATRGPTPCSRATEIIFDSDYPFFQANAYSVDLTVADIEGILNQVDFIFQRDVAIGYVLKQVTVRTASSVPYAALPINECPAGTLLDVFGEHWRTIPSPSRDVVHLMTGRELEGSTIGLAWRPGTCATNGHNSGLSESRFTTNITQRVALTAHELGHNWAAPHDNQDGSACVSTPNGYIMAPTIGSFRFFSECSKGLMIGRRDSTGANCVGAGQAAPLARNDTAAALAGRTMQIDVLRNDVSFCGPLTLALPSATTSLGGGIARSVGTGPDGRDQVTYLAPPGLSGVTDTFTYSVSNENGTVQATVSVAIEAGRVPENPPSFSSGLNARYFILDNPQRLPDFGTLPPYSVVSVSQLAYGSTSNAFASSGRADNVGAVFEGYFNAATLDYYTFYLESDDGSRPMLGDTPVIENDGIHGMQERTYTVALQPGRHRLRVEFFENSGSAGLYLRYSTTTLSRRTVGSSLLSRVPPTTGACCHPNGACTTTVQEICTGQWTGGVACFPNPCPQPTGTCCFANGACEVLTSAQCASGTGAWRAGGACEPNTCPQPFGACCAPDGTCSYVQQVDCADQWTSLGVCEPNTCPQPVGSCCLPDGVCAVVEEADCEHSWTVGGVCDPNTCPQPTGACCAPDGGCTVSEAAACEGEWTMGGACDPNTCPRPTGACCTPEGACAVTEETACGGVWTLGASCDPNACPQPTGACCTGTACAVVAAADCPGRYLGDGAACDAEPLNPTACCPANFDGLEGLQVADVFAFLRGWFENDPGADFDQQNGIEVADVFAFLRAWFAGC